jgi:hypothetical protein
MAKRQYILRGLDDLEGESTVVGKVERVVPEGKDLDLFDMLKLLPRNMRRGEAAEGLKDSLKEAFSSWPAEFGGPISGEAFTLKGPLVVISPLSLYR